MPICRIARAVERLELFFTRHDAVVFGKNLSGLLDAIHAASLVEIRETPMAYWDAVKANGEVLVMRIGVRARGCWKQGGFLRQSLHSELRGLTEGRALHGICFLHSMDSHTPTASLIKTFRMKLSEKRVAWAAAGVVAGEFQCGLTMKRIDRRVASVRSHSRSGRVAYPIRIRGLSLG